LPIFNTSPRLTSSGDLPDQPHFSQEYTTNSPYHGFDFIAALSHLGQILTQSSSERTL
jgi:hypothetical protein